MTAERLVIPIVGVAKLRNFRQSFGLLMEDEDMWIRSKRSEAWHRVRIWTTWTTYITICGRRMIAAEKRQNPPSTDRCLQCQPLK